MMKYSAPDIIMPIVDDGRKVSHEKISEMIEKAVDNEKLQKKVKLADPVRYLYFLSNPPHLLTARTERWTLTW